MRSSRFAALGAALALSVGLAGCAGLQTGGLPPNVVDRIDQVQAYTAAACSFMPTIEAVAAIFAKGSPTLSTAAAVGAAICTAVAPLPAPAPSGNLGARLRSGLPPAPPVVEGVVITGAFIKPPG